MNTFPLPEIAACQRLILNNVKSFEKMFCESDPITEVWFNDSEMLVRSGERGGNSDTWPIELFIDWMREVEPSDISG